MNSGTNAHRMLSASSTWGLAAEQVELVERVAGLSRQNFAARAAKHDAESSFPFENYRDLRDAGLLALYVPRANGGFEADPVTFSLCLLEIAKGCPATALTFNMHSTVIEAFLKGLASEEQQQRYYSAVVDKGAIFASITSEPDSSFAKAFVMRTEFTPVDDGYHVKGAKHFCSLGDAADYYFVSGLLSGTDTAREGIISALIPRENSGIEIESRWNSTAMRGTTSHSIRYDSVVPHDAVIGGPGTLLTADFSSFALGYAAVYLGVAEAAFEYIADYVQNKVFAPATEPISHNPLIQRSIGDMATQIKAARLLIVDAARTKMRGDREATILAVNQAKYHAAEVGLAVTTQAMRMAGGGGILKSSPLERWHRDSLAGPVMPPSNDRCMETIGKILCGMKATTLEFK